MKIHYPTPSESTASPRLYVPLEIALKLVTTIPQYTSTNLAQENTDFYLIKSGTGATWAFDRLVAQFGPTEFDILTWAFAPSLLDKMVQDGNVVQVAFANRHLAIWTNTGNITLAVTEWEDYSPTEISTLGHTPDEMNPDAVRYDEIRAGDWFSVQGMHLIKTDPLGCADYVGEVFSRFFLPATTKVVPLAHLNYALVPGGNALFSDLQISERFLYENRPYVKIHEHAAQPGRQVSHAVKDITFEGSELVQWAGTGRTVPPNALVNLDAHYRVKTGQDGTFKGFGLNSAAVPELETVGEAVKKAQQVLGQALTPDLLSELKRQQEAITAVFRTGAGPINGTMEAQAAWFLSVADDLCMDELAQWGWRFYFIAGGFLATKPDTKPASPQYRIEETLPELISGIQSMYEHPTFVIPSEGVYRIRLSGDEKRGEELPSLTHYLMVADGQVDGTFRLKPGMFPEPVTLGVSVAQIIEARCFEEQAVMDADSQELEAEIERTQKAVVNCHGLSMPGTIMAPVYLTQKDGPLFGGTSRYSPNSWYFLWAERLGPGRVELSFWEVDTPGETHRVAMMQYGTLETWYKNLLNNVTTAAARDRMMQVSDLIVEMMNGKDVGLCRFDSLEIGDEFTILGIPGFPMRKTSSAQYQSVPPTSSLYDMAMNQIVARSPKTKEQGLDQTVDSGQNDLDQPDSLQEPEYHIMRIVHDNGQEVTILGKRTTDQSLRWLMRRTMGDHWQMKNWDEVTERTADILIESGYNLYNLGEQQE